MCRVADCKRTDRLGWSLTLPTPSSALPASLRETLLGSSAEALSSSRAKTGLAQRRQDAKKKGSVEKAESLARIALHPLPTFYIRTSPSAFPASLRESPSALSASLRETRSASLREDPHPRNWSSLSISLRASFCFASVAFGPVILMKYCPLFGVTTMAPSMR